jgi:prolyl 4-hydroxylase
MRPPHPLIAQAFALSDAGRSAEAVTIISRLAEQDEPTALFLLAEMKWRGGLVARDLAGARDLYRRAGEGGHAKGAAFHTNLVASGIAGLRDWRAALARLRDEAKFQPERRQMIDLIRKMKLTADGDPSPPLKGQSLSTSPEVTLYPRLFTVAECYYLRKVAEPSYTPSIVNDASGRTIQDPIRTSDGSTIQWLMEDPLIHAVNRRLAAATGTSAECGEALQILRYQPEQQYRRHLDFARDTENPRILTALIYLNDDYVGGETLFVHTGLKVKGRTGDTLVFRNATADREPDPMSEHAGLPVTSGTKYLASRWIREKRWSP